MAFSPGRTLHPAKALKQKFFLKNFQKGLDKWNQIVYNKYVRLRERKLLRRKLKSRINRPLRHGAAVKKTLFLNLAKKNKKN